MAYSRGWGAECFVDGLSAADPVQSRVLDYSSRAGRHSPTDGARSSAARISGTKWPTARP